MKDQKMKFKVTVEHTDIFGQEMSGHASESLEPNDDIYPAYQLIEAFERAFEACGFGQSHINDYYSEKKQ